ncbi:MAG: iron-sulfur cluster repair di-iron protein [Acidobacteria bacterium]|nr:MAG: iron-sulfur cluster repair di-iron protein [Acidobacteriota bacterium]
MNIGKNTTVGQLAASLPGAVRLFEKLGIDYCCGGRVSLDEVCREKNLAVDQVIASLETIREVQQTVPNNRDWATTSLTELSSHIVQTHHSYVRKEVPRTTGLLDKICEVHGQNRPEFLKVREHWSALAQELTQHMHKEEMVLFPFIERLEAWSQGSAGKPFAPFGSVRNPIGMMMHEHDSAGKLIDQIKGLLTDRTGCNTCLEFFRSVDEFERDLHQHIHLENNILFPGAEKLESLVAQE